jgi:hypothetical protein
MPLPSLKSNRNPTSIERSALLSQIERDTKFMEYLEVEVASRRSIYKDAVFALEKTASLLLESRMRLKGAKTVQDTLSGALDNFKGKFCGVELPEDKPNETERAHSAKITSAVLVQQQEHLVSTIQTELDKARDNVRSASEAVVIGEEDLQSVINVRDAAANHIPLIEKQVQELQASIFRHSNLFRSIWKVPNDVWAHISH